MAKGRATGTRGSYMRQRTPRRKIDTQLIQCDYPRVMVAAMDMVADEKGITRSWLLRAIAQEFLERKFGPKVQEAVRLYSMVGDDLVKTFVQQQFPALALSRTSPAAVALARADKQQDEWLKNTDPMQDEQYVVAQEEYDEQNVQPTREEIKAKGLEAPNQTKEEYEREHPTNPDPMFPPRFSWEKNDASS